MGMPKGSLLCDARRVKLSDDAFSHVSEPIAHTRN